jgi:hypothetical protein
VSNSSHIAGHGTVKASRSQEMEAYDRLGPCMRKALGDAKLPWSAIAAIKQFDLRGWSPEDPAHDRKLAEELSSIDQRKAEATRQ